MRVNLKLLKGTGAHKSVKVPMPKCLIGRGDDCDLRPQSDAVSRRHCAIMVNDGNVIVRDLESRNGTFVNGERVEGDCILRTGDKLQIGPIAFEVSLDHSLGGEKKPVVRSIKEAAARARSVAQEMTVIDDVDVGDWLDEADELARKRRIGAPDTRQLKLDETDEIALQKKIEKHAREVKERHQAEETVKQEEVRKKGPGKLPKLPETATKDSGEAADAILRKFFENR